MTTMKPSIKDSLRRNLLTFCPRDDDQTNTYSGKTRVMGSPNSIMKLHLPEYTKSAYNDVRRATAAKKVRSMSQTQNVQCKVANNGNSVAGGQK